MKKILTVFVLFLMTVSIYTQERSIFPVKSRTVEFGLAEVHAGFANNFISASKIFRETAVIDLDEFKNGFLFNLDVSASPITFNFNKNDIWGFGISTKTEASGIMELSGKMLNLQQIADEKSTIGGSIFAEARVGGFFTINKFKLKFKPALYYPLMVVVPDISYTFKDVDDKPFLSMDYNLTVWTVFPYDSFMDDINLTANPGVDFYFGLEYPLAKAIGLSDKIKILDFGLGLDLYNIPLVPSTLKNYMNISGHYGSDEPINIDILEFDFNSFLDSQFTMDSKTEYGTGNKPVFRPFKMLARADWRPLGTELLTIYPSIGFSLNPYYLHLFSIESGIKARVNMLNFFLASVGIGYEDRLWKNSIDLAINLRAFELDMGIDMRSQKILRSWSAAGLGAFFGLKFGW
ncbi:MAG: hypothetical protein LBB81_09405 [Treponema sp.]|jgi:hypothetical protein|nr:hypothetical protein [Treponema sp.]